MSSYQVSFVSDVTTSTPYTGRLAQDGSVAIYCTGTNTDVMQQQVYGDGETTPNQSSGKTIPAAQITSCPPRLGENVGAKEYTPPVISVIPIDGVALQTITTSIPPNAVVYPTNTSPFYVRSKIWMLKAVLETMPMNLPADHGLLNPFATTTLDNIASYAISAWTTTPIASDTLTGVNIFDGDIAFLVAGSTTTSIDTLIICLGNVTLTNINAGASNRTIIVATGNITLGTAPTTLAGKALLIAGGDITINGFGTDLPVGLTVGAFGHTSGSGFSSPYTGTKGVYWFDGTVGRYTTFNIPAATSYAAKTVGKMTRFDMVSTGSDLALTTGAASFVVNDFTLTLTFYIMKTNDGTTTIVETQLLAGLCLQVANQFSLTIDLASPTSGGVWSSIHSNGSLEIHTNINGNLRISKFVIQKDKTSLPNAGVHTEPFRFDKYAFAMAQTYRVSEDGFVFYKTGRYFTLANAGVFSSGVVTTTPGDIVISASNLILPAASYSITDSSGSVEITVPPCTVSLSDSFPGGSPSSTANQGGMDKYDAQSDGSWKSAYRRLAAVTIPSTGVVLHVKAPYSDHIRYAPRNGTVFGSTDGTLVIFNPNRRAGIVVSTCQVTPSMTSTTDFTTLYPAQNTAVGFNTGDALVVYVDKDVLRFVISEKLYSIAAGKSVKVDGDTYAYACNSTNTIGTLSLGGATANTFAITSDIPTATSVTLVVYFGDMVEETTHSRTETDESFEYFTREQNGLKAHYLAPLVVLGTTNNVNVTFRSATEISAFKQAGFSIEATNKSEYRFAKRIETDNDYKEADDVQIYALVTLEYVKGTNVVTVPLLPGDYTSEDTPSKSITADDHKKVDLESFPFSLNLKTYVAQEVAGSPGIITTTIGDLNAILQAIPADQLALLGTNLNITATYTHGKCGLISADLPAQGGGWVAIVGSSGLQTIQVPAQAF